MNIEQVKYRMMFDLILESGGMFIAFQVAQNDTILNVNDILKVNPFTTNTLASLPSLPPTIGPTARGAPGAGGASP